MNDKLKNIPYWIYDTLSVVSAVITIITAVVAMVNAVLVVSKLEDGTYVVSCDRILGFACILLVFVTILCVLKIRKYGNVLRNVKYEFSNNYYKFLHDFRNTYFEILRTYKSMSNSDAASRVEVLTHNTKTFLIDALDYLCVLMEKNTGRKVCASIKLIENTGNVTNIDKDTATVITFCRSRNSDGERISSDLRQNSGIPIKKNTDFYAILGDDAEDTNAFYQSDLLQYDKDLRKVNKKYCNTTDNFEKYYVSTIVVPIRVARSKVHYISTNIGYDIVGFLCVDSLYPDAFRNNEFDKKNYISIVKSFAAEMYIILNKYNFYLAKINNGGNKNG